MTPNFWRKTNPRSRQHAADGDKARDSADWLSAERHYKKHLQGWTNDQPIWVQLGHALKEQDKLHEAAQVYKRALELHPDDEELRNHYAHLLKRSGKTAEAVSLFVQLFQRAGRRESFHELYQLARIDTLDEKSVRGGRIVKGDAVFIEIDDLLGFLEAHKTVSGIQRVQIGVIQHVITLSHARTAYLFVLNEVDSPYLWKIEATDIGAIVSYLQQPAVDHGELKALVANARRNAEAVLPRKGHSYLILGAFWGYGAVASRYADLKRAGVMVGAYIYDLIPITHTEYCDDGLPHEFTLSFGDGFAVFDFLFAISEYSAREIRRYIERLQLRSIPIITVPLAHADEPVAPASPALTSKRHNRRSPLERLNGRPFAMMVSTIEARKNHGYLVAAWKHFVDEGLSPPDLVFVGRPGWRVTSLMEMLKTIRYLNHRIHIFHDLSDQELADLYDQSLFTLFPSLVEGWGLPVGESLARGKPCIASDTSSIPEVGGDLVDYIDPLNLRQGIEVIRRMAFDTAYRDQRSQEIRTRFKPRIWREVGADLIEHMQELQATVCVNTKPEALFPSGDIFRVGNLALGKRLSETYASHPIRSMLVSGWYGIETMGCWMKERYGRLEFRSDLPPHTDIVVHLGLYTVHFASHKLRLVIHVGNNKWPTVGKGDATTTMRVPVNTHFNIIATGKVDEAGLVCIQLRLIGRLPPESNEPKSRWFAIGMASVAYTPMDDPAARIRLAERLLLGPNTEAGDANGSACDDGDEDGDDMMKTR